MAYGFTYTLPTITGSHTDFPVLLKEADFPTAAVDGGATSIDNGGGNLRAYTDSGKGTQLPIEVVYFVTGGTPDVEVWVKIPTAATGNTIFLEADSVETSQPPVTDTYGRNAVWSDYEAVLHLNDTNYTDSTGNGHNGTLNGTNGGAVTTGHPWGGSWIDFTDSGYLELASSNSLVDNSQHTLQAMVNLDVSSNADAVVGNRTDATSDNNWAQMQSDGRFFNKNGTTEVLAVASPVTPTGAAHWLAGRQNATQADAIRDGVSRGSATGTTGLSIVGNDPFWIGSYYDNNPIRQLNGRCGEVRIRKSALSLDWLATEKDSQDSSLAWGTVGTWQQPATGGIVPILQNSYRRMRCF